MGDFFYICGMTQINDLVGVKPNIHLAIETYARLIAPSTIESLTVTYMGSGGWRIDIGVNENVYSFLNQKDRGRFKRITIKYRFERLIENEMSMIFPFTFEVFIGLSV
jgi:hypothetical protein